MTNWLCRIVFCLTWFASCQTIKPLEKVNLAHQYNSAFQIQVSHRIFDSGNDWSLFLEIDLRKLGNVTNPELVWDKYSFYLIETPNYESNKILRVDSLKIDSRIPPSTNPVVLFYKFPKKDKNRLLTLYVREKLGTEQYAFDIPVYESEKENFSYCLFKTGGRIPIFKSFIYTYDTILVKKSPFENSDPILEYFPISKSVALPPMAAIPVQGTEFEDKQDLIFETGKPTVFKNEGYYFLKKPGQEQKGIGFLVLEPFYPTPTTAKELAEPMIYISTREERKTLTESTNQKLALDQFWLKVNPQKQQVKKLIKSFFENIENANQLFTSHKQGWKTDRGMVNAIYGPPHMVYKRWDTEIWQYDKMLGSESQIFYFIRKPYEKNPNVWELKRYDEYDRNWYSVVELWRKGIINK